MCVNQLSQSVSNGSGSVESEVSRDEQDDKAQKIATSELNQPWYEQNHAQVISAGELDDCILHPAEQNFIHAKFEGKYYVGFIKESDLAEAKRNNLYDVYEDPPYTNPGYVQCKVQIENLNAYGS